MRLSYIVSFLILNYMASFEVIGCTINGQVFYDRNNNGSVESGDTPLANIMVSNGSDVVKTGPDGKFSIKGEKSKFIFIIDPPGYTSKLNKLYHRDFYKEINSLENCESKVLFPLNHSGIKDSFSFAVFGDPQPDSSKQLEYFNRAIITNFSSRHVSFGITLGDIVANDLEMFETVLTSIAKTKKPWYTVIGNHDVDYNAKSDEESSKYFEDILGPKTYAFMHGKVGFLVLDNIRYPDPRDGKRYQADLSEQDMRFASNFLLNLPKDFALVVAFHMPLDDKFDGWNIKSRQTLINQLNKFKNVLILSGHTHLQRNLIHGKDADWVSTSTLHEFNIGTTSGDWFKGELDSEKLPVTQMRDGTPQGYANVNFNGTKYNFEYVVTSKHFPSDFNIHIPKNIIFGQRRSPWIYVNHYIGNELSTVEFRVGGSEWIKMEQVLEYDPTYLINLFKWDLHEEPLIGNRPSNPEISTHLWKATLPKDVPIGRHTIEVKVTDMFGAQKTKQREIRVVEINSGDKVNGSVN